MSSPAPVSSDLFASVPITLLPVTEITIPADRHRENAAADPELVNSIQNNGLLNPIIVRENMTLIAGERRLDAFRQLGFLFIPCRIFESLSPLASHLIELQENRARKQLLWQEETKAIADYHALRCAATPGWTARGTANDLGTTDATISRHLFVAKCLDDPEVFGAVTFTGAFNLINNRADRQIAAAQARGLLAADAVSLTLDPNLTKDEKTAKLLETLSIDEAVDATESIMEKLDRSQSAAQLLRENASVDRGLISDDRIQLCDFMTWAETYSGPAFDVIHCDFPYGKNYKGSNTRKAKALATPTYADSADVYFALVEAFLTNQQRFCLPQAHCLFWFDMMHYTWTVEAFVKAGWRLVQPYPLIWTKGYSGVAADTQRRPRHCYETALLFSLGDRRLRKLDNDHYSETPDEKLHISQKPIKMLRHFLQLIVDDHTCVLDPTCGSGTALAAASQLGAASVLGLELDESNADIAKFILNRETPND